MKIIHTYRPIYGNSIPNEILNMMELSTLLAKKHYGNIFLYTTSEIVEYVKNRNIPYDYIDFKILDELANKSYTLPKIKVYSVQTEPYIHIDYDAFIFDKISFNNQTKSYATHPEGLSIIRNTPHPYFFNALDGFINTYITESKELISKLDKELQEKISYDVIPNFSVFGGYNYKLIAEASKYCLDIYNKNYQLIDNYWWNNVVLEQLLIPSVMKMITGNDDLFTYLFDYVPNSFHLTNETDFPISIKSNGDYITFENETDMYNKIDYNFNGFMHLHGEKLFPIIQKILIAKIQKEKDII
jgi:hypothetical protein